MGRAEDPIMSLQDLPCYHPHFTNVDEVCKALTPYVHKDGSYLVRNSTRVPGSLTISVMHQRQVNHFTIEYREGCGYLLYDCYFRTVRELVDHYAVEDIPNREHISHIRLLHPVYYMPSNNNTMPGFVRNRSTPSSSRAAGSQAPRRAQSDRTSQRPVVESRRGSADPVQLPHPPAQKTSAMAKLADKLRPKARTRSESQIPEDLSNNHVDSASSLSAPLPDRPAPPLPASARGGPRLPTSEECIHRQHGVYAEPRDTNRDMTKELREQLLEQEKARELEMCHCGIRVVDSDLPGGWSVHRSKEPESFGRLFFVSAENETSWSLDPSIASQMTELQKQTLQRLRNDRISAGGGYRHSLVSEHK